MGAKRVVFGPRMQRGALYVECSADAVPPSAGRHARIRWDRPTRRQGETVAVDFGGPSTAPYEHREGAPWKRVTDYSVPEGGDGREVFYALCVAQGPDGAADEHGQEAER